MEGEALISIPYPDAIQPGKGSMQPQVASARTKGPPEALDKPR